MSLWSWIKSWFVKPPAEEDSGPMVSLVLLLAKPCKLDSERLTRVVNRALDLDLEADNPEATEFVTGESPLFMMKLQDGMFCINNFTKTYFDQDPSDDVAELRLRKGVSEHRAWLSVDRMSDEPDDDEAYQIIGKVVAALADKLKTPPIVLNPTTGGLVFYGDDVGDALRGSNPLAAFEGWHGPVPVVPVRGDDPRMVKAIEEAQHRWPEFVTAFENRGDESDAMFAIKAGVREGEEEEFMWMDVTAMEAGIIYGKLENVPVALKKIKLGDVVRIRESDVIDWLYRREDEDDAAGGFTVKAIEEIQREGEAE